MQDVGRSGRHTGQDVLTRVEWEAFQKLFVNGSFGVQFFHSAKAWIASCRWAARHAL